LTHESVLLAEAVEWLKPGPGKVLVDGTVGFGGHARRWLERTGPDGQVVGFDRDPEAVLEARRVLKEDYGDRAVIIQDNYKNCAKHLAERGIPKADALLLDLGVSSRQLDEPARGFSFRAEGPLDMRMDPAETTPNAETLVNEATEEELCEMFWKYGEERFARRIAKRLVEARSKGRIASTRDLENVIFHAVPKASRFIHPATRCFQALRIVVNREIESLETFLPHAPALLGPGGRFAVITFHSLEDRPVKHTFRELEKQGIGRVLTKKPITPSAAEKARNMRARSAKLRVFERGAWEVVG
jgi:16S rRNA (cytosine1402-N4)-methyltransferase